MMGVLNEQLLLSILMGLLPIAFFAVAVFWGLQRTGAHISKRILKLRIGVIKNWLLSRSISRKLLEQVKTRDILVSTLNESVLKIEEDAKVSAKLYASEPATKARIKVEQNKIEYLETELKSFQAEIEGKKVDTLEEIDRISPWSPSISPSTFSRASKNESTKSNGAVLLLLFGLSLSACVSNEPDPVAEFVYEIKVVDASGSYNIPKEAELLSPLQLPSENKVDVNKYRFDFTCINDQRLRNIYSETLDQAKPYDNRIDRDRILAQRDYRNNVISGAAAYLNGIQTNLGQTYVFGTIKECANRLARSGATTKILHIYSDMICESPAFNVGNLTSYKSLLDEGEQDSIIEQIDSYYYTEVYEDWNGVEIIVYHTPSKSQDELFAALMQLYRKWVKLHGGSIQRVQIQSVGHG